MLYQMTGIINNSNGSYNNIVHCYSSAFCVYIIKKQCDFIIVKSIVLSRKSNAIKNYNWYHFWQAATQDLRNQQKIKIKNLVKI